MGDIDTLTIKEYRALSRWKRLRYRLYRHPVVMLGIGPLYVFLVGYRFWHPGAGPKVRRSVLLTNLTLAGIVAVMSLTIGIKAYLMIQIPITAIAGATGVWLFYVQHQFEGVYWERHESWSYFDQAIQGSSYYKLPRVLQWVCPGGKEQ